MTAVGLPVLDPGYTWRVEFSGIEKSHAYAGLYLSTAYVSIVDPDGITLTTGSILVRSTDTLTATRQAIFQRAERLISLSAEGEKEALDRFKKRIEFFTGDYPPNTFITAQ
jgi:hypothetical protein